MFQGKTSVAPRLSNKVSFDQELCLRFKEDPFHSYQTEYKLFSNKLNLWALLLREETISTNFKPKEVEIELFLFKINKFRTLSTQFRLDRFET